MEKIILSYKQFAFIGCTLILLLNSLILFIWQFDLIRIKNLFPGQQIANPVTAVCFILSVLSLFYLIRVSKKFHTAGTLLAFIILFFGVFRLLDIVTTLHLGVDEWLFSDKLLLYGKYDKPNNMAPNTAASFIALSISLLLYRYKNNKHTNLSDYFAVVTVFIAFISITGYLFQSMELYNVKSYIPMAFPTALSFFLIAGAILFYRSEFGLFRILTSSYTGGKTARFLLPFAFLVPTITGMLRFYGEQRGLYTTGFGLALFVTANIVFFVILIWRTSINLNRSSKALNLEIIEKKKKELEISYREKFLNVLVENLPDIVFVMDAELKFVRINKAAEQFFGFESKKVIGKTYQQLFPLVKANSFTNLNMQLFQQMGMVDITEEQIAMNGEQKWLHTKKIVVSGSNGPEKYLLGISQDITERKRIEDELRQFNRDLGEMVAERTDQIYKNQKRFRSLIENSADMISIVNEHNILIYASPAISRIMGINPKEVIGTLTNHYVHHDSIGQLTKINSEVRNTPGVTKNILFKAVHKQGHSLWLEGTMTNLLNDENVKGIVSNFHDVTERVKAEEQQSILERTLLEQKITEQKKMLHATIQGQEKEKKQIGMELHDNINQILASAKLYLDLVNGDPDTRSEMVDKSKEHLLLAISEIRNLSKNLVPHAINTADILEGINDFINTVEISTRIKFFTKLSSDILYKLSDDQQISIYRILQEQINNIVKYAGAQAVHIGLAEKENLFELIIADDGKGFNPDTKSKGIGLSNIKSRTELINGKMELVSAENKGCSLKIIFPVASPHRIKHRA